MGDLISRSDVIKALEECNLDKSLFEKDVFEKINSIPTAYDVEKVVAELEKEQEIHTEHYNISIYKDYPDVKQRYKQIQLVIDNAIDIVKRGAVE